MDEADASRAAHLEVRLPYTAVRHPDYEQAQARGEEWAARFGLLQSERTRRKFHALGYGRLMSFTCPTVALDDLMVVIDWNTYFFTLDDVQHNAVTTARVRRYDRLRQDMQDTIRRRGGVAEATHHPLITALADLCQRTFPRGSAGWARRFEQNLERWLDGHARENSHRMARSLPGVDEYIRLRRDASTVFPTLDLMELVEGAEVPGELYDSPEYRTLAESTADVMCWINDIHSLPVEMAAEDPINLVVILHQTRRLAVREAVDEVVRRIGLRIDERIAARAALGPLMESMGIQAPQAAAIERCVRGQESWAAGMELWDRTDTLRFRLDQAVGSGGVPLFADDHLGQLTRRDRASLARGAQAHAAGLLALAA